MSFKCKNKVRPIPFPYKAAIAISNDAEFMSAEFFEALMTFLNGKGKTPFGVGLGLPVSSSVFFYSAHPYNFSYFDGANVDAKRSIFSDRIDHYLKTGLIDTLHAYGDFDTVGGFRREHAERTFAALEEIGVRIPIFTNHGDIANIQNIGGDAFYHRGDVSLDLAYHTDLLDRHGTRFIWTDSAVYGDAPPARQGWRKYFPRRTVSQKVPLLSSVKLRDGNTFLRFQRFRGTGSNAPNFSSFGRQISLINLPKMYENFGVKVIYQHLGVMHRSNGRCTVATVDEVNARPEVFIAPWRIIARECGEGRLWVTGLSDLLRYQEMLSSIEMRWNSDNSIDLICDRKNTHDREFLNGLTIYVEPLAIPVLKFNGAILPVEYNGPDDSGNYSISVVMKKKSLL